MNTNHRITGSNSSLTLTGDNTKTCTLCWASKDMRSSNRWCVLSEESFLMSLLLLLLKARPVLPLAAGDGIKQFVITMLPASLEAQTRREPWHIPGSIPRRCLGLGCNVLWGRWAAAPLWYLLSALARRAPGTFSGNKAARETHHRPHLTGNLP